MGMALPTSHGHCEKSLYLALIPKKSNCAIHSTITTNNSWSFSLGQVRSPGLSLQLLGEVSFLLCPGPSYQYQFLGWSRVEDLGNRGQAWVPTSLCFASRWTRIWTNSRPQASTMFGQMKTLWISATQGSRDRKSKVWGQLGQKLLRRHLKKTCGGAHL
jgi:hypothetical protein